VKQFSPNKITKKLLLTKNIYIRKLAGNQRIRALLMVTKWNWKSDCRKNQNWSQM